MSKHTLGPWEICKGSPLQVIAPGKCDICTMEGAESNESVMADARLIAASPSMLTVLQAVFNELRGLEDVYDGNDGQQMPNTAMCLLNQFGDEMQSVIESATGKKA